MQYLLLLLCFLNFAAGETAATLDGKGELTIAGSSLTLRLTNVSVRAERAGSMSNLRLYGMTVNGVAVYSPDVRVISQTSGAYTLEPLIMRFLRPTGQEYLQALRSGLSEVSIQGFAVPVTADAIAPEPDSRHVLRFTGSIPLQVHGSITDVPDILKRLFRPEDQPKWPDALLVVRTRTKERGAQSGSLAVQLPSGQIAIPVAMSGATEQSSATEWNVSRMHWIPDAEPVSARGRIVETLLSPKRIAGSKGPAGVTIWEAQTQRQAATLESAALSGKQIVTVFRLLPQPGSTDYLLEAVQVEAGSVNDRILLGDLDSSITGSPILWRGKLVGVATDKNAGIPASRLSAQVSPEVAATTAPTPSPAPGAAETLYLRVETAPQGADVLIDGKLHPEKTPFTVQLPAGKKKLVMMLEGYDEKTYEINLVKHLKYTGVLTPRKVAAPPKPAPGAPRFRVSHLPEGSHVELIPPNGNAVQCEQDKDCPGLSQPGLWHIRIKPAAGAEIELQVEIPAKPAR